MIRAHVVPCRLPRAEASALNRESGRLYTATLVWHYRFFRRSGVWLSPGTAERFGDSLGPTTLHAHSRDAAQQGFYKACTTAKATRGRGGRYPHRRKHFRTTVWKKAGIRVRDGGLLLARARGGQPVAVALPPALHAVPRAAFLEARLVYDPIAGRHDWHFVIEDGHVPVARTEGQTLAADLGEIHPAAVANEAGAVVIFTARDLRALNQYRNKRLASLQARQERCTPRSRLWKRLRRRKTFLLARNDRQRRDIEHKVTRAIATHARSEGARRLVVGDVRDVGRGKRLAATSQQQVGQWSHGRQIAFLTYKLAAEGIALERQDEAYSSRTCPACGSHNKSRGRRYACAACGFVGHRDAVGAVNQPCPGPRRGPGESRAVHGAFGHVQPLSTTYRRAFQRRSSPDTGQVAWRRSTG